MVPHPPRVRRARPALRGRSHAWPAIIGPVIAGLAAGVLVAALPSGTQPAGVHLQWHGHHRPAGQLCDAALDPGGIPGVMVATNIEGEAILREALVPGPGTRP
jgi:hypothetical protein